MKSSEEEEYRKALSYLRTKLSQPEAEVDRWLNGIVDKWVARRRATKVRRQRG